MPRATSRRLHTIPTIPRTLTPLLLTTLLALAACSSGGSTTTLSGPTATTTTAHPTATPPPSQTFAWIQYDASGHVQVWDSIGGALPHQISHNDGSNPCGEGLFGPPVLSPDGAHIAVTGGMGCGQGQIHGPVYVIDVATGALTAVPHIDALTYARSAVWLDNTTLIIGGSVTYTLGDATITQLPDLSDTGGIEGVVRGSIFFYLSPDFGGATNPTSAAIHRYNLTTHIDLGSPISLGSFDLRTDISPSDYRFQGWDVSPDGAHIVYQVTTPTPVTDATPAGVANSQVFYANADGSSSSQILQNMTTNAMITMRLSPDGSQVAVTGAEPAPDIISGCVASPGTRTDPCFHTYGAPLGRTSFGYPAWFSDGRSFVATITDSDPSDLALYRFTVGGSSVIYQNGGFQAWVN